MLVVVLLLALAARACVCATVLRSGYVAANAATGSQLFYYLAPSQSLNPLADPLVLWLSGGPGVSSLTAAYLENGPFTCVGTNSTCNIVVNPYAWNLHKNMLYIDQPVGSGYSYCTGQSCYVTNEQDLAAELYTALVNWFDEFPQYAKNPFFIFGESYAGKYIPSIATYIHEKNAAQGFKINMRGIGIGDGWMYPASQTRSYVDWAMFNGLIGSYEAATCQKEVEKFELLYSQQKYEAAANASDAVGSCVLSLAGNVDQYDIRYYNGDPLDNGIVSLSIYLNEPKVKSMLNATTRWHFGSDDVYTYLRGDIVKPSYQLLPALLEDYAVLVYSGQYDFICNLLGTERMLAALEWDGLAQYLATPQQVWTVGGKVAGYKKTALNLSHAIVLGAGHQAPAAQPVNMLNLFDSFVDQYST
eukprot:TRINITY_DN18961_c0_g1_i1.p1 TRINITY_DN18961_c0_g1~~TRINITY_DN18961_c0_g1_i1.p1  ORF type:complete len:416 (-),score=134.81 TRINITY_DN18961_c0_g1_i1:80-1327(-)